MLTPRVSRDIRHYSKDVIRKEEWDEIIKQTG